MMNRKEKKMKKYKSIGFWIGIAGVIITATGHNFGDFTTWASLGQWLLDCIANPATIIGIGMAVYGAWNNPTQKGVN